MFDLCQMSRIDLFLKVSLASLGAAAATVAGAYYTYRLYCSAQGQSQPYIERACKGKQNNKDESQSIHQVNEEPGTTVEIKIVEEALFKRPFVAPVTHVKPAIHPGSLQEMFEHPDDAVPRRNGLVKYLTEKLGLVGSTVSGPVMYILEYEYRPGPMAAWVWTKGKEWEIPNILVRGVCSESCDFTILPVNLNLPNKTNRRTDECVVVGTDLFHINWISSFVTVVVYDISKCLLGPQRYMHLSEMSAWPMIRAGQRVVLFDIQHGRENWIGVSKEGKFSIDYGEYQDYNRKEYPIESHTDGDYYFAIDPDHNGCLVRKSLKKTTDIGITTLYSIFGSNNCLGSIASAISLFEFDGVLHMAAVDFLFPSDIYFFVAKIQENFSGTESERSPWTPVPLLGPGADDCKYKSSQTFNTSNVCDELVTYKAFYGQPLMFVWEKNKQYVYAINGAVYYQVAILDIDGRMVV